MTRIKSLYLNGYKCFGMDEYSGFEKIKPLNIVIGRNNTGKSSLLDLLTFATNKDIFIKEIDSFQQIIVGYQLDEEVIRRSFRSGVSGGGINGDHLQYGLTLKGEIFHAEILLDSTVYSNGRFLTGKYTDYKNDKFPPPLKTYWDTLAKEVVKAVQNYKVLRLGAERNILPEEESNSSEPLFLSTNGDGATNIIHKFINLSTLDSKLVEVDLLRHLNTIISPDATFTDIVVQQVLFNETYKWEIFLEEEHKGRISLSKSGSGLKTIILVLIQFLLMPQLQKVEHRDIIFALEELENNLHPALQRNLFKFIYEWSLENNTTIFLTTHSHIPINMFTGKSDSEILHIRNFDGKAVAKSTLNFLDKNDILYDLDVKASDLLQSNGLIWVEGPSDRIYINKWINIFGDGKWQEGIHYQIIYYGGRILSHFSADTDSDETDFINLLKANRNCIIVMDSDKRNKQTPINSTKKRIIEEFSNINSLAWLTKGKEVENYIPDAAIKRYYNSNINETFSQYTNISDFLEKIFVGEGKRFSNNKVRFAKEMLSVLHKEELELTLDLKQKIMEVLSLIKKWNT